MATAQPFFWGGGGQKLTPGQVKIMREMAAAKAAQRGTPQNLGEGLASVGDALLYNANMSRANEAESAGIEAVQQALAEARASGTSDAFLDVMGNEWATPGQQLIAGELYKRSIPAWETSEIGGDIIRWNENDPNSAPSVFYDGPDELVAGNLGTTIHAGRDAEGNLVPMQVSPSGGLVPAPLPEGVTWDPAATAEQRAYGSESGKTQAERDLAAPAIESSLQQLDAKTDNVLDTIDKAVGQVGWGETGLVGQVMGGVAGTKAFDLRETVKTIKANLGFSELQAMRDASPTGGALGQVAVQELEALQSTLASLNPDQSDVQLLQNLATVRDLLERQKTYRRAAAEAKYGVEAEVPAGGDDVDAILKDLGL